ncbi:MAG: hypothetical protein CGU28_03350 [Candidatus Dactylopiibacterium carminicum]|nr:MAG: hypothetical protein CGU28_03350 [Candidatus Dactylopiibacterium carminicum]
MIQFDPNTVYDRHWVLEQIGRDEGLLRDIAAVFITDSQSLRASLLNELAAGDAQRLHAVAHCAKSAVSNFGVRAAVDAALALEAAAKADDHSNLGRLTEQVCTELQRVEQALQNELR